jgi:uncharacterized protein (TIGR02145 family)
MNNSIANKIITAFILLTLFTVLLFSGCKKKDVAPIAKETGTLTDIDGNIYKTIKIGNQWWMAENLKVKTFSNGMLLQQAQANNDWRNANAAYCQYDENANAPGLLYNWEAISSNNQLAPAGWHIPTDEEWKIMEKAIGMSDAEANGFGWRGTNESEKLKVESPQGWTLYGNVWASNASGFTALAGSCRLPDATWGDPGLFATGFWWTATEKTEDKSYYRYLDYKTKTIFRNYAYKTYGMSVRCVKD